MRKEAPAAVEFENEDVIAFKSIAPVSKTHILIVPKKHINSFTEMADYSEMEAMTKAAQEIIKQKNVANAYKLVFNGGAYQAVPHLHWHLLAGKLEDTQNVLNKT